MKTDSKQSIIWRIFLVVFSIDMTFVWFFSVIKTENHLPASKMVLLPVVMLVILCLFALYINKLAVFLDKKTKFLLPAFLVGYGLLIYGIGLSGRCEPVHDQEAVYQGALYFSGLSEEINWPYFA